jgi:hypothetical protein
MSISINKHYFILSRVYMAFLTQPIPPLPNHILHLFFNDFRSKTCKNPQNIVQNMFFNNHPLAQPFQPMTILAEGQIGEPHIFLT